MNSIWWCPKRRIPSNDVGMTIAGRCIPVIGSNHDVLPRSWARQTGVRKEGKIPRGWASQQRRAQTQIGHIQASGNRMRQRAEETRRDETRSAGPRLSVHLSATRSACRLQRLFRDCKAAVEFPRKPIALEVSAESDDANLQLALFVRLRFASRAHKIQGKDLHSKVVPPVERPRCSIPNIGDTGRGASNGEGG